MQGEAVTLLELLRIALRKVGREPASNNMSHMPVRQVRQQIIQAIGPRLEKEGFASFKRNRAWRPAERWIDVVQINFVRANYGKAYTTTRESPSLAIGRYFKFCPPADLGLDAFGDSQSLRPDEAECHFRKIVYPSSSRTAGSSGPDNIWHVDSHGESLQEALSDIALVTNTQIVPWFDWLNDLKIVLALIENQKADVEGKGQEPLERGTWGFGGPFGRQVLAGLVAFELKNWDLCVERLGPVVQHRGVEVAGKKSYPLSPQAVAMVDAAYGAARAAQRE